MSWCCSGGMLRFKGRTNHEMDETELCPMEDTRQMIGSCGNPSTSLGMSSSGLTADSEMDKTVNGGEKEVLIQKASYSLVTFTLCDFFMPSDLLELSLSLSEYASIQP